MVQLITVPIDINAGEAIAGLIIMGMVILPMIIGLCADRIFSSWLKTGKK